MCAASAAQNSAPTSGKPRVKSTKWIAADHSNGRISAWSMQEVEAQQHVFASSGADMMSDLALLVDRLHDCGPDTPILLSDDGLRGGDSGTLTVPAKASNLPMGETMLSRHPLRLLGGLSQANPRAVMRGAASRIAGFLSLNRDWDGVVCVPGETTHWALISADEIVSFQSFLTAGLWRSIAPHMSIDPDAEMGARQTDELTQAMTTIQSKPETLAARLAELQAQPSGNSTARATRLWGLLLGAELSAARPYWLGQNIALIAPPALDNLYSTALGHQGISVTHTDADRMALAGLVSAWRGMSA